MKITGEFQITDWKENVEHDFDDGSKLSSALVKQCYQGDIQGDSVVKYQMAYDANGQAQFLGFETFSGQYNEASCRLILKHDGCFEKGVARSEFVIIESASDKSLVGLKGQFETLSDGTARYEITF